MVVYEGMWLRLVECASVYHCLDCEVKDRVDLVLNQGLRLRIRDESEM